MGEKVQMPAIICVNSAYLNKFSVLPFNTDAAICPFAFKPREGINCTILKGHQPVQGLRKSGADCVQICDKPLQ